MIVVDVMVIVVGHGDSGGCHGDSGGCHGDSGGSW